MPANNLTIASHLKTIRDRANSAKRNLPRLIEDAAKLARDTWSERKTRGLFASHLVNDAQSKLVECELITDKFNLDIEHPAEVVALAEVWTYAAIDLLNRALRVIEDDEDIWGNRRPTGGLHDK